MRHEMFLVHQKGTFLAAAYLNATQGKGARPQQGATQHVLFIKVRAGRALRGLCPRVGSRIGPSEEPETPAPPSGRGS